MTKSEREKWDADPWAETPMGSMGVKYVYIYIYIFMYGIDNIQWALDTKSCMFPPFSTYCIVFFFFLCGVLPCLTTIQFTLV